MFKYLKNISILSLYAGNLYHFWLSEKMSNSYNVNKLFIILKHVIWEFRIYIQGVPKKGIDKKLLFGAAQGLNLQLLNIFGFSIFVNFVWCII